MSHNISLARLPYVISYSPSAFYTSGSNTLIIDGTNLSPTCRLTIPASLGTVVGQAEYSAVSSTNDRLVYTLNISTPPTASVTHTLSLRNAEQESTGSAITVNHMAWTPDALVTTAADGWYVAGDLGLVNNTKVGSWAVHPTSVASGLGAWIQSATGEKPVYKTAVVGMSDEDVVLFGYQPGPDGNYSSNEMNGPLTGSFANLAASSTTTWAMCFRNTGYTHSSNGNYWENAMGMYTTDSSSVTQYRTKRGYTGQAGWGGSDAVTTLMTTAWTNHGTNRITGLTNAGLNRLILKTDGAGSATVLIDDGTPVTFSISTNANAVTGNKIKGGSTWLAEIIVLDYALSPEDITLLDEYWVDKYGA